MVASATKNQDSSVRMINDFTIQYCFKLSSPRDNDDLHLLNFPPLHPSVSYGDEIITKYISKVIKLIYSPSNVVQINHHLIMTWFDNFEYIVYDSLSYFSGFSDDSWLLDIGKHDSSSEMDTDQKVGL